MKRREFITLLGAGVGGWPRAARAQQAAMPVVALINSGTPESGARYAAAVDALADDRGVGAVLAMNVPTALTSSVEAAHAVTGAPGAKVVPLIGCWIGGPQAEAGRKVLHEAGIPAYDTPLRAVRGFMHIVQYRRGQRALQRTPPSVPEARSDSQLVRAIVHGALAEKRKVLTEPEAKRVLAAYGIPVVPTEIVLDAAEAAHAAGRIGFPVAVKILSREITHKTDVGGVALDLGSEQAVMDAVRAMHDKVCTAAPGARVDGFVVQPMIKRPHAVELILGAAEDPVFGPILLVGHGGVAAEVIDDKALALPPLDPVLAEDALSRTRVATFGVLCRGCPLRARCTTCKTGRKLVLHPRDDLLRAARRDWAATGLRKDYMAHRPNVERAVAQVATWRGRRLKLRYRGTAKNHAWLKRRTAALNLRNLTGRGLARQDGAWVLVT